MTMLGWCKERRSSISSCIWASSSRSCLKPIYWRLTSLCGYGLVICEQDFFHSYDSACIFFETKIDPSVSPSSDQISFAPGNALRRLLLTFRLQDGGRRRCIHFRMRGWWCRLERCVAWHSCIDYLCFDFARRSGTPHYKEAEVSLQREITVVYR